MTSLAHTSQSAPSPGLVDQVLAVLSTTFAWIAPAQPATFAPAHLSKRAQRLMRADY